LIKIRSTSKYFFTLIQFHDKSPKRKNVSTCIITQSKYDLKWPIPSCNHILCMLTIITINLSSKSKIYDLYHESFGVDEYIFRFDIPMHDTIDMHVMQCFTHLKSYISDLIIVELPILCFLEFLVICYEIIWQVLED